MTLAGFRIHALAVIAGAAALAAPLLGLAAPAQAAAWGHGGSGAATTHREDLSAVDSPNFAGYQVNVTAGSATSSAAQYTVPALSCTSTYRAITPVAGVEVNSGASYSSAFLFVGCYKGKASYFPALVVNGTETNYTTVPIKAGNVVKVSAKVTTTGTTVQITNVTTSVTKKLTGAGASSSAAYIGDSNWDNNGTMLGVPSFGTVTFSHSLVDGKAISRAHPAQYQRVNSSNKVQISTGALTSGGSTFATHFKHS